ncbi:MAG: hypothetical protein M3Q56_08640 [Bacteroidota bacterium]|nr:hypothetical protein [Bacteroidota bacterium]
MSSEPKDVVLWKYATGTATEDEVVFVEEWLQTDESVRIKFERIKLMISQNKIHPNATPVSQDNQRILQKKFGKQIKLLLLIIILIFVVSLYFIFK